MMLAKSVHYLLFHTLVELISVAVSFSIFTLAWASRQHLKNGYLIVLGAAYVTTGTIDVFHTLTFKGMAFLPGVTTNHPTQFWLTARFIEAASLLIAPLFVRRTPNFLSMSWFFAIPGALACVAVLMGVIPSTYVEGVGLTPFKIAVEYLIIVMLLAGLGLLWRCREEFTAQVFRLLAMSLLLAVATEFCFIHYFNFYDFTNELGHYFRFLSVVLAYLALIVTGVRRPADILYRQLLQKEEELQASVVQLRESKDRLNRAQAVAGVGSWYLAMPSQHLTWSDETYRIFGVPLGIPQSFETFAAAVYPEDLQGLVNAWENALHGGAAYDIEHRILVRGEVRWVHEHAEIGRNCDGDPIAGIGTVQDITGRKLAELALRESQERYQKLYEKTPAIMHSIDAGGNLISVSDLWLSTFGYARAEVMGKKSSSFLTEASKRFALEEVLPKFFRTGWCADISYQFLAKDGRVVDVLLSAYAERDSENRIVRSFAVMVDVTAQRRTEAALAESELRFQGAFEAAAQGMALVSTEGRFIKVNRALCTMVGYDESELLKIDFQTITHRDDLATDLGHLHDLTAGRIENYRMEKRYFHKSGRLVWILLSVSLVRTRDGAPLHFVSQIQDITEGKQQRQSLENLLAEQKSMLENELIGIVKVRNRIIVWASPAFESMLGYASGELVGTTTRQYYPSDKTYEEFGAVAYPILSAGKVYRSQIEHVRKDGSLIWVDISGGMLDPQSGESLWGFLDVTERKHLEQRAARNEQRMELALAGADLGWWDLDLPSGRFSFNDRVVGMLGHGPDEIDASIKGFTEFLHPEDMAGVSSTFYDCLKGKTVGFEREYRLRHKDDCWMWVLSRGKVVERDGQGRAVRMTGTNLDISKRKHNETELKVREARLSTLISSMQDIVVVYDTNGCLVEYFHPQHASRPAYRPRADMMGKTNAEILPADVAQLFDDAIVSIVMDGKPRIFEYHLAIGGDDYLSEATVSPLLDEDGYLIGFLGLVRDITAERAAQRKIEHLAHTNALLLDNVGEGIYGVDLQYKTSFVNPAAVAMLGFPEVELLGQAQHALFHHHRQDGTPYLANECPIGKTLNDGRFRHAEDEWFWRKDGTGFPVSLTVTPLIENGQQTGAVVVFQDITERKAVEAQIHSLAFFDPLTHLPNRRMLIDRLEQTMVGNKRSASYGALMFLDLDNFKPLNDAHGHVVGDSLLVEAATRLKDCVRETDTVARFGGDEFVVMLCEMGTVLWIATTQAGIVAEKIRDYLSLPYQLVVPDTGAGKTTVEHRCTVSIGVTMFQDTKTTHSEILTQADNAMYQAKQAGRNLVQFAENKRLET